MLGHGGGELKTAVFHLLGALAEPVPPGLYVAGERSALDEVDAGELATSCSDFMRGTMVMAFFGLRFHAMQFDCISRDDLLVVHRLVALSAVASRARVQLARAQFGSDESLSAIVAMPHADRSALSRLHTRVAAAEMEIRMLAQRHFEDKFTFASCYAYVVLAFVYHGSSVSLSSHFASVAMHRTVDLVARWVDGREPAPSQRVVQEMAHLREGAYWFLTGGFVGTVDNWPRFKIFVIFVHNWAWIAMIPFQVCTAASYYGGYDYDSYGALILGQSMFMLFFWFVLYTTPFIFLMLLTTFFRPNIAASFIALTIETVMGWPSHAVPMGANPELWGQSQYRHTQTTAVPTAGQAPAYAAHPHAPQHAPTPSYVEAGHVQSTSTSSKSGF